MHTVAVNLDGQEIGLEDIPESRLRGRSDWEAFSASKMQESSLVF